jgi:hypothetical protein
MFHLGVTGVLSVCCKSKSGCCTCCICCKHLFPMFYLFQTYITSVLSGCYIYICSKCFIYMLCMFAMIFKGFLVFKCFRCMFHLSSLYVAIVASECFKSRSGCCIWDVRGKPEGSRDTTRRWERHGGVGPNVSLWAFGLPEYFGSGNSGNGNQYPILAPQIWVRVFPIYPIFRKHSKL